MRWQWTMSGFVSPLCAGLLTALISIACVPAELELPAGPMTAHDDLMSGPLQPALGEDELEQLDFVVVLAPQCWRADAPPALSLATRAAATVALPDRWQDMCSFRPRVVTGSLGSRWPVHEFTVMRSGHLSVHVPPGPGERTWATRLTSSDLVGLREQLARRPDWTVVDEQAFARWLGVDPDWVRPGRSHGLPLEGRSWFIEDEPDADLQSGCPLRDLVDSRWLYLFDGRHVELLAGPGLPLQGVLEHWQARLERSRPPVLLADAEPQPLAWQVVGNQLVEYPRCTTGEMAIAARWIEAQRRRGPSLAGDGEAEYIAWLYRSHAVVGEPPPTLPNLAYLLRRMYLTYVHLRVLLAWTPQQASERSAAIAAWWLAPDSIEMQPQVLCDMQANDDLSPDDPLAAELFARVFPQLLELDADDWQALANAPEPSFDPSRRARARRDAFMLGYVHELPAASRPTLERLCTAWREVGRSPGEPRPCTSVAMCDER